MMIAKINQITNSNHTPADSHNEYTIKKKNHTKNITANHNNMFSILSITHLGSCIVNKLIKIIFIPI